MTSRAFGGFQIGLSVYSALAWGVGEGGVPSPLTPNEMYLPLESPHASMQHAQPAQPRVRLRKPSM